MNPRYCLLLNLVLVFGCSSGATQPTHQPSSQPGTPEQLNSRLIAAESISNPAQRNEAIAAVAQDAADEGAVEIVKQAIRQINGPAQKDDVAYACALKLSERGKAQAATELAKSIANPAKKDEALGKIAKGGK